jgi:hypothetical protein
MDRDDLLHTLEISMGEEFLVNKDVRVIVKPKRDSKYIYALCDGQGSEHGTVNSLADLPERAFNIIAKSKEIDWLLEEKE